MKTKLKDYKEFLEMHKKAFFDLISCFFNENEKEELKAHLQVFTNQKRQKPIVKEHIKINTLLLNFDNLVNEQTRLLVFGVDKPKNILVLEFDNEDIRKNAFLSYHILKNLNLKALPLWTGNKSFHLWVVLEDNINVYLPFFRNKSVVNLFLEYLESFFKDSLKDLDVMILKSQNMKVRVPFTIHHKTLYPSFFLKEFEKGLKELFKAKSEQQMKEILLKYALEGKIEDFYSLKEVKEHNTNILSKILGLNLKAFNEGLFVLEKEKEKEEQIVIKNDFVPNKSFKSKIKLASEILNYLTTHNLKDGRNRAIGILYALSVLTNKKKEWFIGLVKSLSWIEGKYLSKAESYYRHYEEYKNKEWVNWGWIFNRFKEIKAENKG